MLFCTDLLVFSRRTVSLLPPYSSFLSSLGKHPLCIGNCYRVLMVLSHEGWIITNRAPPLPMVHNHLQKDCTQFSCRFCQRWWLTWTNCIKWACVNLAGESERYLSTKKMKEVQGKIICLFLEYPVVYLLSVPWESSVGFCSSTDESAGSKSKRTYYIYLCSLTYIPWPEVSRYNIQ